MTSHMYYSREDISGFPTALVAAGIGKPDPSTRARLCQHNASDESQRNPTHVGGILLKSRTVRDREQRFVFRAGSRVGASEKPIEKATYAMTI